MMQNRKTATKLLPVAFSKIDKSVSRGIQHRNTANTSKTNDLEDCKRYCTNGRKTTKRSGMSTIFEILINF